LFDYVARQKNYKDDRKSAAKLSLNRTRDGPGLVHPQARVEIEALAVAPA